MVALIPTIISSVVGLVLDIIEAAEKAGVKVDKEQLVKDTIAQVKKRIPVQEDIIRGVLDILDGNKPLTK